MKDDLRDSWIISNREDIIRKNAWSTGEYSSDDLRLSFALKQREHLS